jgi:murein DD-endopeptidase MepM/ murein hydrolase activator NlpD
MIAPLALGADSGRRMAATGAVRALKAAPERPELSLLATLAPGDSLSGMLRRAGVGGGDAARVLALVGGAIDPGELAPGTQVDITLGRRSAPGEPRALKSLSFRARFDLALAVERGGDAGPLALTRTPIRIDETPLRIRGTVGPSLYRSARAAGAPPSAVQAYLRALGQQVDLEEGLLPTDTFDIIVQHRRAATGERQAGELLYAGIDRDERPRVQLVRWGQEFYEASGVGEQKSGLVAPVPGRMTSHFGQRRHPILGYVRMHAGIDFKASYGTPIVAVTDGRVSGAGRMGGCGNAVRIDHGGSLQTRYCHMSQIAARGGQYVRRGQVIGYVGSSGLSTGPHLHYEMYREGRPVNPAQIAFVTRAQLSGSELKRFRESLSVLKDVAPGAALGDLAPTAVERAREPVGREIDRLDQTKPIA